MPTSEDGVEAAPRLALPQGVVGTTPCWVVRFTGEVFKDYE